MALHWSAVRPSHTVSIQDRHWWCHDTPLVCCEALTHSVRPGRTLVGAMALHWSVMRPSHTMSVQDGHWWCCGTPLVHCCEAFTHSVHLGRTQRLWGIHTSHLTPASTPVPS